MRRIVGLGSLCVLLGACGGAAAGGEAQISGGAGGDASVRGGAPGASSGGVQPTEGGSASGGTSQGGSPVIVSDSGGSGGSSAQGGGPAIILPRECRNATPHPEAGGYVQCGTGEYQRTEVALCTSKLPRPERNDSRIDTECWFDAECTARPHGYCAYGTCTYGCVSDEQCAAGSICFCGDPIGRCVPAACRSAADCSDGYPCYSVTPGQGFACERPDGHCGSSGHCSAGWTCSEFEGRLPPEYPYSGCSPPPG